MVNSKYYWTAPPFRIWTLFVLFGVASTLPALLCNLFLSRETEFWIYSPNRFYSFMGFCIGAGLGEEFWKLSFGCVALFILLSLKCQIKGTDLVVGFVSLGLAFAVVENLVSYIHLEFHLLITRGLISIPLHASMGMIHGLSANKAREEKSVIPLLSGYFVAATLHTLCDTWGIFLPQTATRFIMVLMTIILVSWSVQKWRKLPEVTRLGYTF